MSDIFYSYSLVTKPTAACYGILVNNLQWNQQLELAWKEVTYLHGSLEIATTVKHLICKLT